MTRFNLQHTHISYLKTENFLFHCLQLEGDSHGYLVTSEATAIGGKFLSATVHPCYNWPQSVLHTKCYIPRFVDSLLPPSSWLRVGFTQRSFCFIFYKTKNTVTKVAYIS
jgi:hypothetical protein